MLRANREKDHRQISLIKISFASDFQVELNGNVRYLFRAIDRSVFLRVFSRMFRSLMVKSEVNWNIMLCDVLNVYMITLLHAYGCYV